jgi:hypothetical protein
MTRLAEGFGGADFFSGVPNSDIRVEFVRRKRWLNGRNPFDDTALHGNGRIFLNPGYQCDENPGDGKALLHETF